MEQQVFEGFWEEIVIHAEELLGRRVKVTVLSDKEASTLDQTLLQLLEASETLELKGEELIPSNLSENTREAFTDVVVEKYRKQGFNL